MSETGDSDRQRRRFVGKIRIFNEQRRRELSHAGFPLIPEEQHMVLEDYLDISRRRHLMSMPLFKLQLHMLQDLVIAERAIAVYKRKKRELLGESPVTERSLSHEGNAPGGAAPCGGSTDPPESDEELSVEGLDAQDVEERPDIRAIDRELFFLQAEIRAIRDIADGIAWRLFDYDRAVLHELARRSSGKHINAEGLEAELHEFASAFNNRTGIAVLNDLTTFLKFGDVTIRHESGEFEIAEVKSSGTKSGRITRQRQGLTELVSLLSSERGQQVSGEPLRIMTVDVVPEMFAGNVRGLIQRAATNGSSFEAIGSHLLIECLDFMSVRRKDLDRDRVFAVFERGRAILDRWEAAGDIILPNEGQERYAHAQNYVPFSIFPLDASVCVRLMTGATRVRAYLNVSAVLREIEGRGWKVLKGPRELMEGASSAETPLAVVRKGPLTTSIAAPLMGRLAMEFLKPRSLVGLLDGMLTSRVAAGYGLVNFVAEHRMWQ